MKKILMIMLSGFLTTSLTAQTLTISFSGTNSNNNNYGNTANRNRNYQVVLDGTSYYSNSGNNVNANTTDVNGNTGTEPLLISFIIIFTSKLHNNKKDKINN